MSAEVWVLTHFSSKRLPSQIQKNPFLIFSRRCTDFIFKVHSKVGIHNFSPHLRNSAILRRTKSIAELRTKKSCGTEIAELQNFTSATLCSLRPVPLLSSLFPQLKMVLKINQNVFRNRLFLWKPKTCPKG